MQLEESLNQSSGGEDIKETLEGASQMERVPPPRSAFEARRQARIDRLRERADRKNKEGNAFLKRADSIASFIPPGQPILVGHHSEKRHRRDLDRIHNSTRKGFDSLKESERLNQRAEAAESNTAIFTEDPDAVAKLEKKISRLEKHQATMKQVNTRIRKGQSLTEIGFSEALEAKLRAPDELGRVGFPDYALKNNNANIRRLKLRLAAIKKSLQAEKPEDMEKNGIRIVENVEDNRVQIFFPSKPVEAIRGRLKRFGFRWSPFNGCWQRHRSSAATEYARTFLNDIAEP